MFLFYYSIIYTFHRSSKERGQVSNMKLCSMVTLRNISSSKKYSTIPRKAIFICTVT